MTHIYDTTLKMHNATQSATNHSHSCKVEEKTEGTHMVKVLESAAN